MIWFMDSLSFGCATLVVALISGLLSGLLFYIARHRWRWIFPAVVPVMASYLIYWSPAPSGADASEYAAWSLIFLLPWSGAGIIVSVLICLLIRSCVSKG